MLCTAVLPERCIPYFVAASTFLLSREYTAEIKYLVYL